MRSRTKCAWSDFFCKFSKTRPSMEHWAKNIFEKITPRHVQNTFGHFWERFWSFLEFLKIFDFLKKKFLSLHLIFYVRKAELIFSVRESELITLSPEN